MTEEDRQLTITEDEIDALAETEKKNAGGRKFVLALGRLSEKLSKGQ